MSYRTASCYDKVICPEISVFANNCYSSPSRLFIRGGKEIPSQEGTTQGDPIAMAIYALRILPLLTSITYQVPDTSDSKYKFNQVAFADDITGVGSLKDLKIWWLEITRVGPFIGYFANPLKSWLIVKER